MCSPVSKLKLSMCAAVDKVDAQTPSKHVCQQFLHLNLSFSTIKDALPNFIPLYMGMPVILCMDNLSTELGIKMVYKVLYEKSLLVYVYQDSHTVKVYFLNFQIVK
jgi:hypothetical protein